MIERRQIGERLVDAGAILFLGPFVGMAFALMVGVSHIPLWVAFLIAIVPSIGAFLLMWGLDER